MASGYQKPSHGGKATVSSSLDKPCRRIKTPSIDTSRLIMENQLTLVGRTTNPREQIVSALLLALPRQWELKGKVTGADLGQNSFQFRFELKEDLLTVLAARPFHYAHWMVVLQRWEPIISPTFPSQIPFWIRLHGIPLHYWDDKVLTDIGQDLGTLETYNISKTSTKVRVLIDAFKPLVKETIMEFDSGEDLMITLDYDGLENHCSICNSLTHWKDACPERGLNQGIDQAAELRDPRSNRYISPPRPTRREPIHSQQN